MVDRSMIGIMYLLLFLAAGLMSVRFLLPRQPVLTRVWLGCSFGLLLLMWLPALWAFAFGFTVTAHIAGAFTAAALTAGFYFVRDRRPVLRWNSEESKQLRAMLPLLIPYTLLCIWLQYTHTYRITEYGAYNVGQSTYGDLAMHMSFITSLKNSPFPPEYAIYPGHRLSYPFLADSISTSFLLMGWDLQGAAIVPAALMMILTGWGVCCLGRKLTHSRKTLLLAALLFLLNGGLGFLYDFDQAAGFEPDGSLTVLDRLETIFTGYYKTPANQPEPNNLRWSNVIADLMLPQRTLNGGWAMVLPCLYLLFTVFPQNKPQEADAASSGSRISDVRGLLLLGLWAGALPLIHTHSFLALALISSGLMMWDLFHGRRNFSSYILYAAVTAVLALPQLIHFTFTQTFQSAGAEGAGHTFLTFQFNWVNNPGGNGMRDFYFWFYIKNIGLPFVVLLLAILEKRPERRRIFAGMLPVILAAEFIRFQPNEYDNNKLFYLAWLLGCFIAAEGCSEIWHRLKGLRARPVMAAVGSVLFFLTAVLSIGRECVSDYELFSDSAVNAAAFIEENTPEHSTFLTGTHHQNPVCSIAGRNVVCGSDLYLYWHGFDTSARQTDIWLFYDDPAAHLDVIERYDVDYIYVSEDFELRNYDVDVYRLNELFPLIYDEGGVRIWAVPEG